MVFEELQVGDFYFSGRKGNKYITLITGIFPEYASIFHVKYRNTRGIEDMRTGRIYKNRLNTRVRSTYDYYKKIDNPGILFRVIFK
jgi:hypothetical protein